VNETNDPASIWHELLEDARYTPSPHNVQPWKLRIDSDSTATLLYDPTRLIPDEDIEGSFTLAAFGIFLEYLAIIALAKGYQLSHVYNGNRLDRHATRCTPLFQLTLKATDDHPAAEQSPIRNPIIGEGSPSDQGRQHGPAVDPALIRRRRTSRLPYKDQPISGALTADLTGIAAEYGHTFAFSSEPEMIRWVLQLNADTLFYDMKDDLTRREVDHWLRYTKREAVDKRDGLAAYCLLIPGLFLRLFFRHQGLLKLPFVTPIAKWYYMQTMRGTSTVGWISGPYRTPDEWLATGHMLGRIWLKMTEHGVYLHPFGSTITNPIAHKALREKFAVDEDRSPLWMIMRLGHSSIPPRSQRLTVDNILTSD